MSQLLVTQGCSAQHAEHGTSFSRMDVHSMPDNSSDMGDTVQRCKEASHSGAGCASMIRLQYISKTVQCLTRSRDTSLIQHKAAQQNEKDIWKHHDMI